jgi:hypothetical protein
MRRSLVSVCAAFLMWPATGAAQPETQTETPLPSRTWIVVGAASATVRGDCQTCEEEYPYRHSTAVLGNIGYRLNARADIGGEILWVPIAVGDGHIRVTHFDAVAQFRPWRSHGFFLKGGAGMAFVRNWVDATGPDPINSKALSVVIGGGWAFRPMRRVGFQVFASQHAGAIGDLQVTGGDVPDVMSNYWMIGGALVFR